MAKSDEQNGISSGEAVKSERPILPVPQWKVGHDGPSRPIIEHGWRMFAINEFINGKWESFDDEEEISQVIVDALNARASSPAVTPADTPVCSKCKTRLNYFGNEIEPCVNCCEAVAGRTQGEFEREPSEILDQMAKECVFNCGEPPMFDGDTIAKEFRQALSVAYKLGQEYTCLAHLEGVR